MTNALEFADRKTPFYRMSLSWHTNTKQTQTTACNRLQNWYIAYYTLLIAVGCSTAGTKKPDNITIK